jgi:hypothetical protein
MQSHVSARIAQPAAKDVDATWGFNLWCFGAHLPRDPKIVGERSAAERRPHPMRTTYQIPPSVGRFPHEAATLAVPDLSLYLRVVRCDISAELC